MNKWSFEVLFTVNDERFNEPVEPKYNLPKFITTELFVTDLFKVIIEESEFVPFTVI